MAKRYMDLVRSILLKIEESGDPELRSMPTFDGVDEATVAYHIRLMIEAGLVEAIDASTMDGEEYMQISLAWQGHEFLEQVRDPEIWRKTKDGAAKVGSYSLGVIAEIAKALVVAKMKSIGLPI